MAKRFWAITRYHIPFDDQSVMSLAHSCIDSGLLCVLEDDGYVVGFVAGAASPCIANRSVLVGAEIAFWIEPDFRGHGRALLESIEHQAKSLGIQYFSMMALESIEPDRVGAMYEHMGYAPAERTHLKRLF